MADTKISALAAVTTLVAADVIVIVDDPSGTPVSKKATVQQVLDLSMGDIRAVSATGAAVVTDGVLLVDASGGAVTITLPAASGLTSIFLHIKKIDSSGNAVTVDGNGSETIDGALTSVLTSQWETISLATDGTGWFII